MSRCSLYLVLVVVLSCFGQVVEGENLYVPDDFPVIQDAIDTGINGDVVIVRDGVWTGFFNKRLDFLGKAITVRSENGPQNCIIDCEREGRGFHFHLNETAQSILDGFTIKNGYASPGGGISIDASSPTIRNCIITDSIAMTGPLKRGGGIWCQDSSATISRCQILRNVAGAGGGGGVYLGSNCTARITNCRIEDNQANAGGGIQLSTASGGTFRNCLVRGNQANSDQGAGIWMVNTESVTMVNCSILNNLGIGLVATNSAGGTTIGNCIFWDNTSSIVVDGGIPLFVRYSDVQGGYIGGNIDVDPSFMDDFHLGLLSPCIDTGDPNFVPTNGEVDLDGDPRVINERVDIGCDEVPDSDIDGDGVIDDLDVCDNTPKGIPVDGQGRPIGDIDSDCDVDLLDFGLFQGSFTGQLK